MPLERIKASDGVPSNEDAEDENSEDLNLGRPLFDDANNISNKPSEPINEVQLRSFRHEWIAELESKNKKPGTTVYSSLPSTNVSKNAPCNPDSWYKQVTFPEYFPQTIFGKAGKRNDSAENGISSNTLVEQLQARIAVRGSYFELESPKGFPTILNIPLELLSVILKYVVGSQLDVISLETMSLVSSGFYFLARNQEIWYLICKRIFGISCTGVSRDIDWRQMFITVPHAYFHGVYIGKCSYVRHGETSFQDQFYRPCHIVVYYRHFKFFADGTVIMVTSSEHPAQIVPYLKSKTTRYEGALFGHYKSLDENCLLLKLYRRCESSVQVCAMRSSARRKDAFIPHEIAKQEFDIELQFGGSKKRSPHCVLQWAKYDCQVTYLNGQTSNTSFDLVDKRYFPPLFFSRVRSFAQPDGWDNILE